MRRLVICSKHGRAKLAAGVVSRRGLSSLESYDHVQFRPDIVAPHEPGFAGVQGLHTPEDFGRLSRRAVKDCEALKARIAAGQSDGCLGTLRDLDSISNTVCSVVDVAEFCRQTHVDAGFREAAEASFDVLSDYIQELNTDSALHNALQRITSSPRAMAALNAEQRRTAALLQAEFERDGVHLPAGARTAAAALQGDILRLETAFNANITAASERCRLRLPADAFDGVPAAALPRTIMGTVSLPLDAATCSTVLRGARRADTRRQVLRAQNAACAGDNTQVLEQLVVARHRLARLLGCESYAHYAAADRVLGSPDEVMGFLEVLSRSVEAKAAREAAELLQLKAAREGTAEPLQPWDVSHYMAIAKAQRFRLDPVDVGSYFTLDSCLSGLAAICRSLFGIELVEQRMAAAESWDNAGARTGYVPARKIALVRPPAASGGVATVLGTVYLDLGARPGKFPHAAHYTIRGSRAMGPGGQWQTPVVAVVASFALPFASRGARLMSHGEAEALLHEFGHALHSLLSATEFQHASGTRAPMDWVEVPSLLMEYFAWDERTLPLLSAHHATGEPLPRDAARALRESRAAFAGLETQQQITFSAVDMALSGPQPSGALDLESVVAAAHRKFGGPVAYEGGAGGAWYSRFAHFTSYGAGYYSYLYDRVLASNIWNKVLQVLEYVGVFCRASPHVRSRPHRSVAADAQQRRARCGPDAPAIAATVGRRRTDISSMFRCGACVRPSRSRLAAWRGQSSPCCQSQELLNLKLHSSCQTCVWEQAFALWLKCFSESPLSRSAGDTLSTSILAHGGGKDPHDMLADILAGDRPTPDSLLREWGC